MNLRAIDGGGTSRRKTPPTTKTVKSRDTKATIGKKTVEIGEKEYIDAETGEVKNFSVISMEDKDFNFQKIWLAHILDAIQEFGSAKMQVLMYLISKREKANNMIAKTIREIAKDTKISLQTITDTLKILEKHDIIKRKTGVIILNPDVIFKGSKNKRMSVLLEYHNLDDEPELTPLEEAIKSESDKTNKEELLKRKAEIEAELEKLKSQDEEDEDEE